MADEFLLDNTSDSNPATWNQVATLLSTVSGDITLARALEWSYQPYARAVQLHNGQVRGLGYPIAVWRFGALRFEQRENLKDFCSGLSTNVYIRTPTNETAGGVRIWDDFLAIMKWTTESEIVGLDVVEQVILTFTHLQEA